MYPDASGMQGYLSPGGLHMLTIFLNDGYRILKQKKYLFVALGLTVCAVIMAIFMTAHMKPSLHIAAVNAPSQSKSSAYLDIDHQKEAPSRSSLIQNQYDAAVIFHKDGTYDIKTAKNASFKSQLESILEGKPVTVPQEKPRGIGTAILGFMMMFLLMQGILYARMFAEDKEKHVIERITASPIPFYRYLGGHCLFIWMLIFVPSLIVVTAASLVGVSIGFALWQYALMISITALLSTCFAVCINAFFNAADTANMVGSCLVVLSSILSGSFYEIGTQNSLFKNMLYVLPQKGLLQFIQNWEADNLHAGDLLGLSYVIIGAGCFLLIGVIKTRKDYSCRKDM